MKRFKLGFRNRSVREQLEICQRLSNGVGKLPKDQRAALAHIPLVATVTEAAAAHAAVERLRSELRSALRWREIKLRAARKVATRAALAVYVHSKGNATAQLAAGLELQVGRRSVGQPAAPGNLRALPAELEGTVRLRWKRPVRRCLFIIEMTRAVDAAGGWKRVASSLKQTCTVTNLASGMKHWFRVAATNAHGQGPWSNPICVRAA